jgi:hypothetical protein
MDSLGCSQGAARGFDGFANLVVTRAAAKIPHHPGTYFFVTRVWMPVQERFCTHHHPWRTDATLKPAMVDKRLLDWMQAIAIRQPFNSDNVCTVTPGGQLKTSAGQTAIDGDGARTANPNAAAFLGARQLEIIAQTIQQQTPRLHLDITQLPIQPKLNFHPTPSENIIKPDRPASSYGTRPGGDPRSECAHTIIGGNQLN